MAEIIYRYNPNVADDGLTRSSFASIEQHYKDNYGGGALNLGSNGNNIKILIPENCTMNETAAGYDVTNWTTAVGCGIEIYGVDALGNPDVTRTVTAKNAYACFIFRNSGEEHFYVHHLTMIGRTQTGSTAVSLYKNGHGEFLIVKNFVGGASSAGLSCSGNGSPQPWFNNCLIYGCSGGVSIDHYRIGCYYNCTVVDNLLKGVSTGTSNGTIYLYNCAVFNNVNNFGGIIATLGGASWIAGETGDTIPDTVGGTSIVIDSTAFADYASDDFKILYNSKLRHNHVDFPSGNNQHTTYVTSDIDGDIYPATYTTDDDQWDIGYDYYVEPVTGIIWRIKKSDINNKTVNLLDTTNIIEYETESVSATMQYISSGGNRDSLYIVDGVHCIISANDQQYQRRGFSINIVWGSLDVYNENNFSGMNLWGWQDKKITVNSLGLFKVIGNYYNLGKVILNNLLSAWGNYWGSTSAYRDDNDNYPEPSVLFVGENKQPYMNLGASVVDFYDDDNIGCTFKFITSSGQIIFPDYQPSSASDLYCYNVMLHSKNGQSTNVKSYGFDVSDGGEIEIYNMYNTGSNNFEKATNLILSGYGIIQNLDINDCKNVNIDVYRGNSRLNVINATTELKNLLGESTIGNYRALGYGNLVKIYTLINCGFNCFCLESVDKTDELFQIGDSTGGGVDNLTIEELKMIGGGLNFDTAISINPYIKKIIHSNDIVATNTHNGNVVSVGSFGTRDLQIDSIVLSGFPTMATVLDLNACGDFEIKNINYNGRMNYLADLDGCFNGKIYNGVIGSLQKQFCKLKNNCKNIIIQNMYSLTAIGTPVDFEYFVGENLTLKNIPIVAPDRYLLSGWDGGALIDTNFMELNQYNPLTQEQDGVIVFNFYYSTDENLLILNGGAVSNKDDAVLFFSAGDYVELEIPYSIKPGSSSADYFKAISPKIICSSAAEIQIDYKLDQGDGYGEYKNLTLNNLSAETFSADDFDMTIKVQQITSAALSDIKQVIIYTNPDVTVQYPIDSYTLTLTNIAINSEVRIYDSNDNELAGTENVDSSGIFTYTYQYSKDIPIKIYIHNVENYKYLKLESVVLSNSNQSVVINQERERWYNNPD